MYDHVKKVCLQRVYRRLTVLSGRGIGGLVIWLLWSFTGLAQLPKPENFHVTRYTIEQGLPTNDIYSVAQDRLGFIWLATSEGLVRFDGRRFVTFRKGDPGIELPENNLLRVFVDRQNRLWIMTKHRGLVCFELDHQRWKKWPEYTARDMVRIPYIVEDADGNIWAEVQQARRQYVLRISSADHRTSLFEVDSVSQKGWQPQYERTVIRRAAPKAGNIWTDASGQVYKGIYAFRSEVDTFDRRPLPRSHLDSLLYYYVLQKKNVPRQPEPSDNISFGAANAQTLDGRGRIWWTNGDGIDVFDPAQRTIRQYLRGTKPDQPFRHTIFALAYHPELDVVWIGQYRAGLMAMDLKTGRLEAYPHIPFIEKSMPENQAVIFLFVDRQQGLWIATEEGGLAYYHPMDNKFGHYYARTDKDRWLTHNTVQSFAETAPGEVWIGTKEGLHHWNRISGYFERFIRQSKLWQNAGHSLSPKDAINNITSLLAEPDKLWIGTWGHGLHSLAMPLQADRPRFEPHLLFSHQNARTRDDFSNRADWLHALVPDGQGRLWLSNWSSGQWVYDQRRQGYTDTVMTWKDGKYQEYSSLYSNYDSCKYEGYNKFKGCKIVRSGQNLGMATDGQYLWAGTEDGLYRTDLLTKEMKGYFSADHAHQPEEGFSTFLPNDFIPVVFFDRSDNTLWVGTADGLALWDSQRDGFVTFGLKAGFQSTYINGILSDDRGHLWISTNNGLAVFRKKDGKVIKTYKWQDGLQGNGFLPRSAYRLSTGEMLFGGVNGFNVFHPDSILNIQDTFLPPVVLVRVKVQGRERLFNLYDTVQRIHTTYDSSNIDLSVVAPDFAQSGGAHYRYRLLSRPTFLGIRLPYFRTDTIGWYEARNGNIEMPNQRHGDYVLEVQVTDHEGQWSRVSSPNNPLRIQISVEPPFYLTWWFWIMAVAMLLIVAWRLYRYRITRLEQAEKQLKELVAERTEELWNKSEQLEERNARLSETNKELEITKNQLEESNTRLSETVEELETAKNQLEESNTRLSETNKELEIIKNQLEESNRQLDLKFRSHSHDYSNYWQLFYNMVEKGKGLIADNKTENSEKMDAVMKQFELMQIFVTELNEIDKILYEDSDHVSYDDPENIRMRQPAQIIDKLRHSAGLRAFIEALDPEPIFEIDIAKDERCRNLRFSTVQKAFFAAIVYEVWRNSLKHAFQSPGPSKPVISISMRFVKDIQEEDKHTKSVYELEIADNGRGMPDQKDRTQGKHGMNLLEEFAKIFKAWPKIDSSPNKGTRYVFQLTC